MTVNLLCHETDKFNIVKMKTFPNLLGLEFLLDRPYSTVNFDFSVHIKLAEPTLLGSVTVGYLRSGDHVGSQGNEDMTVWYQDGTKWTINKSWFE